MTNLIKYAIEDESKIELSDEEIVWAWEEFVIFGYSMPIARTQTVECSE
jgi:hypothetical protein